MSTVEFLAYLRSLDVKVWTEGGRLRLNAPKNVLTPALRAELAERKADILAFLRESQRKERPDIPPLQPAPRDGDLPLSFAQERLWILEQLEPGTPNYNISGAVHLTGALDVVALEQSINEIVRRHESLRTTFVMKNGRPVQVIAAEAAVPLSVVDLSALPQPEREAEVQRLAVAEARKPFDLAHDQLLRVTRLQLGATENVLLVSMHHIVGDGWSSGVFVREFGVLYEAFAAGRPSPLPDLPIQYADFACWQRQWLQGEMLERQMSYWKQKLAGISVLQMPADRPRPPEQTYKGARYSSRLSVALTESINALSRQEDVTLFITLLAAFQTLLHHYSGQDDISVGTPIANRTRAELEGLIGFFVNTLIMRTSVAGDPTFRELLPRARETALGAYDHQDLPFEKLVAEVQPDRDLSRAPLFQVMFALQNAPVTAVELPGLTLTPLKVDNRTAKFDLLLSMVERDGKLEMNWEYNTDLFDDTTITRLSNHFEILLESIVANPDQRLSELTILAEAERQQLRQWNDTWTDPAAAKPVHLLVEEQVERTPDAIAVMDGSGAASRLTYRELNRRANQLAHHLRSLGVGPDVPVGICMERSPDMAVAVLGVLKAGGPYVPLDPAYPRERLAFMLEDTRAPVLLTQSHVNADFGLRIADSNPDPQSAILRQAQDGFRNPSASSGQVPQSIICLDTDWETIAQESAENPVNQTTVDNLIYIIYTSGSTGKPKGVALVHHALSNLINWQLKNTVLGAGARTLQFASLSFDVSCQELFTTWSSGGALVLITEELRRDTAALLRFLDEQKVERLFLPFIALQHLAEVADSQGLFPKSLREVITAGEQLQKTRHIVNMFKALPLCTLYNQYGPSESHVVTAYPLPDAPDEWPALPPIGRPIDNTQIYLLDAHLQPVPVGVTGELYIGGVNLARGYLNRPNLTAERFIQLPVAGNRYSVIGKPITDHGSPITVYRTGDLARYLPDGNIEFLGRIDHQVKIRGFRIELGEIETVLSQHTAVQENVIMAREDASGNKRLVAYIVHNQDEQPTIRELRQFLAETLPEYMIPSTFMFLDAMPLTPSGKIARRALPEPDQARPEMAKDFVAPQNKIETQLTQVWEELLEVRPIGVDDNFFELGGHSLLAVRLFAQIEEVFGVNLPIATLFKGATIRELSSIISQHTGEQTWDSLVEIQPNGSKPPFFCVHGGTGDVLWFRELSRHLGSEQPFYGLQSKGLDGIQEPLARVEDMAAHYISAVRAIQPEGPYYLGGYCFGGIIVYEMAQQLRDQGEEVALLMILSRNAPKTNTHKARWTPGYIIDYLSNIPYWLINLWELGPQEFWARTRRKVKVINRVLRTKRARLETADEIIDDVSQLPEHRRRLIELNQEASREYLPQAYPGRITVLQPRTPPLLRMYAHGMGWDKLATEGITIKVTPGSHQSMFKEPRVQHLASNVREAIEETRRNL